MENRVMRNICLALLGSSLILSQTTTRADELLADANTNFGPARPAGVEPAQPVVPKPKPTPAPAPVAPTPPQPIAVPVAKTPPAPANPEAEQMAQDETLRRQADQVQARALIDEGSKLYYAGKYDLAIVKLEEAVKLLPRAKATEIDYNRATTALGDSYQQLADRAYRANDNAKALDFAKKAIQYDPTNRSAENLIVKIKQAEREAKIAASRKPTALESPSPAKDPELQAKKDQIRRLFREGKILLSSGQFDEAEKRFQQILLLDPYNGDAQEFIRMVSVARGPSSQAGQEAARTRALWQVDDAWLPPIGGEVRLPDPSAGGKPLPGSTTALAAVLSKLNEIKFPQIRFRDASLVDVVGYLSEESRKLDPKGEGVNIVLGPGIVATPAVAAPVEGEPAAPAGAGNERRITLDLRNVPMIEALRYITSLSNLKYRIESSAVLIVPFDYPDQSMITRFYPVTAGSFTKFVTTQVGGAGGGGGGGVGDVREIGSGPSATVGTVDVKELFSSAGVPFPQGSSIVYNERTSTIVIHNTPENIEAFERALPSFDVVPKQIEIETRFIDISQGDLDELGFSWKVGQKNVGDFGIEAGNPNTIFGSGAPNPANFDEITAGLRDSSSLGGSAIAAAISGAGGVSGLNSLATIKGILTDPQFEVVIKALSQKKTADVLSAPKITTINGVQAQIKVVQEFIYPSEYTEPQVSGGAGGAVTPTVPSAFKTREVGVILNVTPTVGSDNYTINLALTPEVSEFLGFLDYSPGEVTQTSSVGGSNTTTSVPYRIQQPLFSTRTLATSVVIWDGQTVVLGGLIKENIQKVDDKVPFLGDIPIVGRLFRSKATTRSKQNLLIFVTARLVDPAGNPIHKTAGRANR
ncbi:MAG: hypothetical protein PCFJNLEI_01571 [Verrucomicrobiae bacterium]|nr:hypothetical protein [Verrucomicrobiae bacterium]